jgi:hypothetical protein
MKTTACAIATAAVRYQLLPDAYKSNVLCSTLSGKAALCGECRLSGNAVPVWTCGCMQRQRYAAVHLVLMLPCQYEPVSCCCCSRHSSRLMHVLKQAHNFGLLPSLVTSLVTMLRCCQRYAVQLSYMQQNNVASCTAEPLLRAVCTMWDVDAWWWWWCCCCCSCCLTCAQHHSQEHRREPPSSGVHVLLH